MTSFDPSPSATTWRTLLALAVVFVMLATTGWTAVRERHDPDVSLKEAFAAWQHDRVDGRRLPDPQGPPQRVAHFFDALSAPQRKRLVEAYPLVVGNLNGAPVGLRFAANRLALAQSKATELRRMANPKVSRAGRQDADRRMHRFAALLRPHRQVLAFDPAGGGRVAEVFGDLDRASRISVVVPGVDTNVVNFERTYLRYSSPVGMAKSLYAAEREAAPGKPVAVIAWADYTAPTGLGMDAMVGAAAQAGARRLAALTRALPGSGRGPDVPVSLFCHSYGSVVCGVAARQLPERVTDIAVSGSPGMRADSAAELGTTARVWAMRDADDWIQGVPYLEVGGVGHGTDPVSAEFGARVLSAADAVGHTGYFVPGTESIGNFARIGVGAYDGLSCAGGGDSCRDGIDEQGGDGDV
ncbi:alpha/beta hydrolase [Streptomyces sp. CA-294286]|uniref:alpha/beta hydrolase n=1 Tax=Streptomyces sp. CA-294286 TaxID=3240070 RepID=UPI003D8CF7B0